MIERPDFEKITLGEWLALWYDTYKKPYLKPYSLRNIEQMIRLHTPVWLKALPLAKITLFDIDKALTEIPLGRTRGYTRQVWNSAFVKACRLGIMDRNVVDLADKISYKKKKSRALTISEQQKFIEALEGKWYKWLMLFYLHTGVRRSEALTLEWSDIDEAQRLILIKGTKTENSFRYILLTDEVKAILDGQKKQTANNDTNETRVFPYVKETVSRKFKEVCPAHHLHDLRHTFVTRCAECGVNINVCQQLVGHSTADMTMNVYTHVLDEFKRKEALKFSIYPNFGQ